MLGGLILKRGALVVGAISAGPKDVFVRLSKVLHLPLEVSTDLRIIGVPVELLDAALLGLYSVDAAIGEILLLDSERFFGIDQAPRV